jgi:hypothetical protein
LQYRALIQFPRVCPVRLDGANQAGGSDDGAERPGHAEVDNIEVHDQEAPEAPQESSDAGRRDNSYKALTL